MSVFVAGLLCLALLWLLGGLVLRVGGLALLAVGMFGLVQGQLAGLMVAGLGVLMWLAGHWVFSLRHQRYKGPLARVVFCRWFPAWMDSTPHG